MNYLHAPCNKIRDSGFLLKYWETIKGAKRVHQKAKFDLIGR